MVSKTAKHVYTSGSGPRYGSKPIRAKTHRTNAASVMPVTMQSIQAGKKAPSMSKTGSQPGMSNKPADRR